MVFGTADPESTAARLVDRGPRVAAVSMAEAGAYVAWADGEIRLPTVARTVEGAQGGGDALPDVPDGAGDVVSPEGGAAVAQVHGLAAAGRGAGRRRRPAAGA